MTPPPGPTRPPLELCLGGSFNPIHVGHLITARAAAEAIGASRVRLVVAGTSPHKANDPNVAPAAERVALCRAAVGDDPAFVVDDRETRRPGRSYTADTADELRLEQGGEPVRWLIGADLLAGLPTWHRAAELLADPPGLVRFVVMHRPGNPIDWESLPPAVRHLRRSVVIVPQIDVSSTQLRERIARGQSVRYFVPEPARELLERAIFY